MWSPARGGADELLIDGEAKCRGWRTPEIALATTRRDVNESLHALGISFGIAQAIEHAPPITRLTATGPRRGDERIAPAAHPTLPASSPT